MKLPRRQRPDAQAIQAGMLLEPAPDHPQIGGRELPLDLARLAAGIAAPFTGAVVGAGEDWRGCDGMEPSRINPN